VAAVAAAVGVLVFAIGGVEAANLELLLAAGVHRACVIRGLAEAADPEAAARRLRAALAS
jgi:thiamine-phosphate pyrophosphorylase